MTTPFLLGVNLAGAEFGSGDVQNGHENPQTVPGIYGKDYTYPTHEEIDYYASKGLDVIRTPVSVGATAAHQSRAARRGGAGPAG